MRLLHASDWHLGRTFHGVELIDAQREFDAYLVEVVRAEGVDAVLVSDDVYDRATPSLEAVEILEQGLTELSHHARVIVSSGNYDSARRDSVKVHCDPAIAEESQAEAAIKAPEQYRKAETASRDAETASTRTSTSFGLAAGSSASSATSATSRRASRAPVRPSSLRSANSTEGAFLLPSGRDGGLRHPRGRSLWRG